MKKIFYICVALFSLGSSAIASAISEKDLGWGGGSPTNTLPGADKKGLITVLALIQGILIKLVLPLVCVGATLYIAYELLTADGNEEKLKKTWKSITFSAIGIISIVLAYALISIVTNISF